MPYTPHTEEDVKSMLATIGVNSIDDLFIEIPAELRIKGELNIPSAMSEHALFLHMASLASQNVNATSVDWYLGAGLYDRFIPASVRAVISRGEFLTAYTPYQPEMSQGYLQTIYEFQSMIAELYGMDLANASMYDGSTSMAEAAVMATGMTDRNKIVVSTGVHPRYREVLKTYCWAQSLEYSEIDTADGLTSDYSGVDDSSACIIVQSPNFFGQIEDLGETRKIADQTGAIMVTVADPVAMALLKPPGEFGSDIVVGEAQPMGVAMGYGGPLVGLFATSKANVRKIPGRIVGKTHDAAGRKGYAMTLRTREQDIRREKATSNICTNEALMALASTVYMAALGKNGMKSIAESSARNSHYAAEKLCEAGGKMRFGGKYFTEFVVDCNKNASEVRDTLLGAGIMAGLPLGEFYPELENCLLVATTEVRTKAQIDRFAMEFGKAIR